MTLPDDRYLGALDADREAISGLSTGDLSAPVAACPGWSLADLLRHLGSVQRWAAASLVLPPQERARFPRDEVSDDEVLGWFDEGFAALIATLRAHDLDEPCATFAGPRPRRWWLRRQALESAVHRWDAELALQLTPSPLDGELAVAGIDEWCEIQVVRWFTPADDLDSSFHLHATDGDGEWLVEARPAGLSWRHGHEKGDLAVRGSRSDLYLALWNRVGADRLEIFGDPSRWDAMLAAAAV